jgi:hypothetical protein
MWDHASVVVQPSGDADQFVARHLGRLRRHGRAPRFHLRVLAQHVGAVYWTNPLVRNMVIDTLTANVQRDECGEHPDG